MGVLRYRTPSGERKFWTFKEIVQGKSMRRVTHPFFVVFPIACGSGALVLDILSRLGLEGAGLAATYAMLGAVIGAVFAIGTGLVDRSLMRPGSKIRTVATRHMYIQLLATLLFVLDAAVRWGDRHTPKAEPLWLVLDVLAVAVVILGGDVGASMVFRMGYRVHDTADPAAGGQAVAMSPPAASDG